jgi:2-oxoglutarate ferredoxin oxidoreductase subunit beta
MLMDVHEKGEVLTGVFYVDTQKPDFTRALNMVDEPLGHLAAGAHASRPRSSG